MANTKGVEMSIRQLQAQAHAAPKFVLHSNQFGFDMYVADTDKYDGVVTDTTDDAMMFSVGFDDPTIKAKAWSLSTGYSFTPQYL